MSDKVEISMEDLKHLFDLAVDSPTVCSGSFETDDVDLLRKFAVTIGVDPNNITPEEFRSQYPHSFEAKRVRKTRGSQYANGLFLTEDDFEDSKENACAVRRCGKSREDGIHS